MFARGNYPLAATGFHLIALAKVEEVSISGKKKNWSFLNDQK